MAEQLLHSKANISASWIYNNEETPIVSESIKSIVTQYNFDEYNMPALYLNLTVKSYMYQKMVQHVNESKIYLNIQFYNCLETAGAREDFIKWQFKYFIPSDQDYNSKLAEADTDNTGIESEAYVSTTIGLIKDEIIDDNKKVFNGIYKSINKATIVCGIALSHVSKLCIETFDNNETIDYLIVPVVTSVTNFLKYVNNKIKVFYKYGYRYFHDFDIVYLLSESGNYVPDGTSNPSTVIINVVANTQNESKSLGCVIDKSANLYTIYIDAVSTNVSVNSGTPTSMDNVVLVDEDGNTSVQNTTSTDTNNRTEYVRTNETDNEYMSGDYQSNLNTQINKSSIVFTFTRLQLDESIFTPNKEYQVINYPGNEDYNGRYILSSRKTSYNIQDGDYIPSVAIELRKVVSQ